MSEMIRDEKSMRVADAVLRRAAHLVPVMLSGTDLFSGLEIDVPAAREANLRNLAILESVGREVELKGAFWRDLIRACELLDCPDRMPSLVAQYHAALQRVEGLRVDGKSEHT